MATSLTIIDKVQDPLAFCKAMAPAAERFCGAKTLEEAEAINMICLWEGLSYLDFNRKYHMIKGKPSMKYDAMLAEFRRIGGTYKIIARTSERAACEFAYQGNTLTVEFTWEQAKESRWPWKDSGDKSQGLKDNWSTPADRQVMLFARLVSDSLRVVCPEVAGGIYTPEEVQDMAADAPVIRSPGKSAAQIVAETSQSTVIESRVVEAEPVEEVVDVEVNVEAEGDGITDQQKRTIRELYAELGVPDEKQKAVLAKRGVSSLNSLTRDQAAEIITRLEQTKSSLAKN